MHQRRNYAEVMKTGGVRQFGPAINRIADVMAHIDRYAFKGVARLAEDAGVSSSSVSRLINGRMNPSFAMAARITEALERRAGLSIGMREVFSEDGAFRTRHICELMRCRGCLPEAAIDASGAVMPAFRGVRPGQWVTSRWPRGYGKGADGK